MITKVKKMIDTFADLITALEQAGVISASIILASGQFIEIGTHPPPSQGEEHA